MSAMQQLGGAWICRVLKFNFVCGEHFYFYAEEPPRSLVIARI
jgi:hypothetical protein